MDLNLGVAAIALLVSIGAMIKRDGKDQGLITQRLTAIEGNQMRHDRMHADHFEHAENDEKHFRDTEMHWSSRERDQLGKVLEEMAKNIREMGDLVRASANKPRISKV